MDNVQLIQYLAVLILALAAVGITAGMLLGSVILGQRARRNRAKDTAYECGMIPVGDGSSRLSVKFYLVAMLFILFDIEVVFLVPWALVYREFLAAGIAITAATAVFLGVLVLGLAYEFKRGALEWDK